MSCFVQSAVQNSKISPSTLMNFSQKGFKSSDLGIKEIHFLIIRIVTFSINGLCWWIDDQFNSFCKGKVCLMFWINAERKTNWKCCLCLFSSRLVSFFVQRVVLTFWDSPVELQITSFGFVITDPVSGQWGVRDYSKRTGFFQDFPFLLVCLCELSCVRVQQIALTILTSQESCLKGLNLQWGMKTRTKVTMVSLWTQVFISCLHQNFDQQSLRFLHMLTEILLVH